ncbi:hypothetical protein EGW08_006378 [Elysia chlorotica]|uniref:Uncharacterized protein n=1 Tax=Elysia chlorotica TaxID=188477 RepID=A0A3S1BDK5_ELYCH|nr:hypothetical protein EGW08_006378 [Elysia chlorotica]
MFFIIRFVMITETMHCVYVLLASLERVYQMTTSCEAETSAYERTTYWRGWNECLPKDNLLARLERVLTKGQPTGEAGTSAYQRTTYWRGWNECLPKDNPLARQQAFNQTMHTKTYR